MQRIALAIAIVAGILAVAPATHAQTTPAPNFIFILTDDQPIGTLDGMPNALAIRADGTEFNTAIISNSLCCPSRTSILTGLYSHDSGVYTNGDGSTPDGGYPAFIANGDEDRTFALALHDAGYQTGLFGKYLNRYDGSTQVGWDAFHSFVGKNGAYYNYDWVVDGGTPVHHASDPADYSTDVAGSEANMWLQARDTSVPFLLYYSPFGPHGPVTPAPQDVGQTTTTQFATPAYNEGDVSDKPGYIQAQPPYTANRFAAFTTRWNQQYATLLSVDRWIGAFRATLEADGQLQNTYFIFLSDNGQTWGDHRWDYKVVPYERSIRVPMLIDGPGVLHQRINKVVSNIDLASTILDLAGVTPMPADGLSLRPALTGTGPIVRRGVLLEHETYVSPNQVPTYCGFRTGRWMFTRYANADGTREEELYDLRADPYELTNVVASRARRADQLRSAMYAAGCDQAMVPP